MILAGPAKEGPRDEAASRLSEPFGQSPSAGTLAHLPTPQGESPPRLGGEQWIATGWDNLQLSCAHPAAVAVTGLRVGREVDSIAAAAECRIHWWFVHGKDSSGGGTS